MGLEAITRRGFFKTSLYLAAAAAGARLGCGITDTDSTPPWINENSISPKPSAKNLSIDNLVISAGFTENVNYDSVLKGFSLKDSSGNKVDGTLNYNNLTYTATFTPTNALKPGETYTATLQNIKDTNGNVMKNLVNNNTSYSWSFKTKYLVSIDNIIDNDSDGVIQNAKVWINGNETQKDKDGKYKIYVNEGQNVIIEARGYDDNGNAITYKRTERIKGVDKNYENLNLRVVSYPTQEGVSKELFYEFCRIANFRRGSNGLVNEGLKSFFGNANKKIWIGSHGFDTDARFLIDEQNNIKKWIEEGIYPYIKEENRPEIYLEDPNNLEEIPYQQNGVIAIVPRSSGGFGAVPFGDENGNIKNSVVYIPKGGVKEESKGSGLQEILSGIGAPNQVPQDIMNDHRFDNLTVLRTGIHTNYLTEIDQKLLNITQFYQVGTDINDILEI